MKTINNVYRNLGASILPQVVNIISSFILPVMIIGIYGSVINGLVSTVRTIISYISLVGAGIAVATTQALYLPVAKNDEETVRGMLKATSILFNKCGWVYLGIVFVVSLIYPFLIKDDISYYTCVGLLLIMSISGASEFFVVGRCRSLLYANQRVYVSTTIQAVSHMVSLVLAVIMLSLNSSILIVQLSISSIHIIKALFFHHYVKRNFPQYVFYKNTKPIQAAVKKRKDAMVHQLSGLLVLGSQSVLLSSLVGLEAASIYAVYNIVFSGIHSICSNMNTAVTPFIGKSLAVNKKEIIEKEFNVVEYLFYILTSFSFMVSSVMIIPFIELYTQGADISYNYPLFALLFVILSVFNVYRLPNNAMINAAGHFKETRWRAIAEAIICVVCSIIFTILFGLYGVLIGTICAIGWRCLDIVIYSHWKILYNSVRIPLFRLCRCMAYVLLFYLLRNKLLFQITGYVDLIINALIVALVALLILSSDTYLFERSSFLSLRKYLGKK